MGSVKSNGWEGPKWAQGMDSERDRGGLHVSGRRGLVPLLDKAVRQGEVLGFALGGNLAYLAGWNISPGDGSYQCELIIAVSTCNG